jgi:hypothetical protein
MLAGAAGTFANLTRLVIRAMSNSQPQPETAVNPRKARRGVETRGRVRNGRCTPDPSARIGTVS